MSKQTTESTLCKINRLLGIDESYRAPAKMLELISDEKSKNELFLKALMQFNYDLSYEWFNSYFEDEHADRKKRKQDFTPTCISNLMGEMLSCDKMNGVIIEPAAGTGSTVIAHWGQETKKCRFPWEYNPADYLYICYELADKTIPFLLFNLLIRGMNAAVIHGNTLTKETKTVYACINEKNSYMSFSRLIKLPQSAEIEHLFDVKFTETEEES